VSGRGFQLAVRAQSRPLSPDGSLSGAACLCSVLREVRSKSILACNHISKEGPSSCPREWSRKKCAQARPPSSKLSARDPTTGRGGLSQAVAVFEHASILRRDSIFSLCQDCSCIFPLP
jgi:hypothetical protein